MAALDANDVTLTIDRVQIFHPGGHKRVEGTMAIAATDTYPTAGIPLPAIGKFGFKTRMDTLECYGQTVLTNAYTVFYNKAAHKLQLFRDEGTAADAPFAEVGTSEAPGARSYQFVATGW